MMKGKKIDVEFITTFVAKCVQMNKATPEEICQEAKNQIQTIDEKIKEINYLKIQRSKLQDVLSSFDNAPKKDNSKEKLILNFYNVEYKAIALQIMQYNFLDTKNIDIAMLMEFIMKTTLASKDVVFFTIKQLLELKILERSNERVLPGINFDAFYQFIINYLEPNV